MEVTFPAFHPPSKTKVLCTNYIHVEQRLSTLLTNVQMEISIRNSISLDHVIPAGENDYYYYFSVLNIRLQKAAGLGYTYKNWNNLFNQIYLMGYSKKPFRAQ